MTRIRPFLVWLALFAVIARALLPDGWMPNRSSSGAPIVMCTSTGIEYIVLDENGKPVEGKPQKHNDICPFTGLTHLAPPKTSAVLMPDPALEARRITPDANAVRTASPYSSAYPRAPSLFA
jgi:hypothetical protein